VGRILIVSEKLPPSFGGGGVTAARYAKGLRARGRAVTLLTRVASPDPVEGVRIISLPKPVRHATKLRRAASAPLRAVGLASTVFRLMRNLRPTLVHCVNTGSFSLLCAGVAKLFGASTVLETTLVGSDDPVSVSKSRFGRARLSLLKRTDAIVNVSPALLERCQAAKLDLRKCHVIPNPVEAEFSPVTAARKSQLRAELGLSELQPVLLFAGILRPRKNPDFSLATLAQLRDSLPQAGLVFLGPTDKDPENATCVDSLRHTIERLRLGDHVLFPGFVKNVHEWMQASDFFVFSPSREGFGNVFAESMCVGLPTITRPLAGITDFIFNESTGVLISTPAQAAREIERLHADSAAYQKIAIAASTEGCRRFSVEAVTQRYLSVYDSCNRSDLVRH
jgi:glycosyltransferase involved in cell wall biosynthesis